jgi:hypothetical protein
VCVTRTDDCLIADRVVFAGNCRFCPTKTEDEITTETLLLEDQLSAAESKKDLQEIVCASCAAVLIVSGLFSLVFIALLFHALDYKVD